MNFRLDRIVCAAVLLTCVRPPLTTVQGADRVPVLHVEVSEDAPIGALVADLTELQGWNATEWRLTGGDQHAAFELDPVSGRLRLRNAAVLDHEQRSQHLLTVRATIPDAVDLAAELFAEDLQRSGEAGWAAASDPTTRLVRIRVHVLDAPEPPHFVAGHPLKLDRDNPLREVRISAIDADASETLRFEIVPNAAVELLQIDSTTGRLSLTPEQPVSNVWPRQLVALQVRVTDSQGLSTVKSFDVDVVSSRAWERYVPPAVAAFSTTPIDERPIAAQVALEPDRAEVVATDTPISIVGENARVAEHAQELQSPTAQVARSAAMENPAPATPVIAHSAAEVDVSAALASESAVLLAEPTSQFVVQPAIDVVNNANTPDASCRNSSPNQSSATIPVTPAGLRTGGAAKNRLGPSTDSVSILRQLVTNWGLLGLVLCAMAAAVKIAIRRRQASVVSVEASAVEEIISEEELVAQSESAGQIPTPRAGQRVKGSHRSLRKEMADLLKVSQHFTVKQKAQQQRRFHGRQFWLAAVALVAAGAIALAQGLLGLDRAFDPRNWIVLGCLTLMAAAALRSFMRVRVAADQMNQAGPLTGEFRID